MKVDETKVGTGLISLLISLLIIDCVLFGCLMYKCDQVDELRYQIEMLEDLNAEYKTIASETAAECSCLRDAVAWYEDIIKDNFTKTYKKEGIIYEPRNSSDIGDVSGD